MASNPSATRQSPAKAARTQQSADIGAAKRQARAKRQAAAEPPKKLAPGQIVEITGKAKVDASDAIGTERTDHQGAVAQVEGHYYSPERGVQMTRVRTEDNKMRVIPEDRLTDVTHETTHEATEAGGSSASMTGICSAERWDNIFGKKAKHSNLMSNADRRAQGRPQDPDLEDYQEEA